MYNIWTAENDVASASASRSKLLRLTSPQVERKRWLDCRWTNQLVLPYLSHYANPLATQCGSLARLGPKWNRKQGIWVRCTIQLLTWTTHAYDASRHSKRPAALMGHAVLVSGVARLVGVERTVQKNGNVKSEPKYLAGEESPIRAFYFWTLSCPSVALFASTVGWFLCFLCL